MPTVYNPFVSEVRTDPYPIYQEIRDADPVQFNPYAGLWTLARHADCISVLRDLRFSSKLAHEIRRRHDELPPSMLNADPPEHARLRAPAARLFTRTRMQPIWHRVRSTATELLMERGDGRDADLMSEFARPLVTRTFVDTLGIPPDDLGGLSGWIWDASLNLDPLAPPEQQAAASEASQALSSYFGELIAERRRSPGNDLLSALVDITANGAKLTESELVNTCSLLLIGGHDPAVHLIGNGIFTLLKHPSERHRVRDDAALLPAAVEEILRFESPIQLAARVALEDVEIGDLTVSRGDPVIILIGAANRDPAAFDDPERLDVGRTPNPHIAFGAGAHLCLGASLARAIGQTALEVFLTLFPDAHLATDEPHWCDSLVPRGLRTLPVTLR